MDITASSFPSEVVKILEEVANSHLLAFDLEFSGVAPRRPNSGKLTLQEYYEDTKAAAQKYQILQVGFTIVSEDVKTATYTARPYNFNISPLPRLRERVFTREWSYQSGAITFLDKHGFKFDLPITQGIWYLSRTEEQQARTALIADDEKNMWLADMELKPEDNDLVQHIRTAIQKWQSNTKPNQEQFLNIPDQDTQGALESLTRYQVRITHQTVRAEFPNLKTTGMGYFVQVTNPTAEQQASQRAIQEQEREQQIAKSVGFRWLVEGIIGGDISGLPMEYILNGKTILKTELKPMEYLQDLQQRLKTRRRVLVGHNCFTDLVYFYACFIGDLPATVEEFQININEMLPGVVDTKYLASKKDEKWSDTSLEAVHREMELEFRPKILVPGDHDKYSTPNAFHEAGFDSLITAKAAVKLSAKMEREKRYSRFVQPPSISDANEFGMASEDGYVTANESIAEIEEWDKSSSPTSARATTTAASRFGLNSSDMTTSVTSTNSMVSPKEAKDESLTPNTSAPEATPSVVPVKERQVAPVLTGSLQVESVRKNLAKMNMYNVLDGADDMNEQEPKQVALEPSTIGQDMIDAMIKKGELMPRWEGGNHFWQIFGNQLQVGGSKEGVCKLS